MLSFKCQLDLKSQKELPASAHLINAQGCFITTAVEAPVVRRLDNALHCINPYPVDKF